MFKTIRARTFDVKALNYNKDPAKMTHIAPHHPKTRDAAHDAKSALRTIAASTAAARKVNNTNKRFWGGTRDDAADNTDLLVFSSSGVAADFYLVQLSPEGPGSVGSVGLFQKQAQATQDDLEDPDAAAPGEGDPSATTGAPDGGATAPAYGAGMKSQLDASRRAADTGGRLRAMNAEARRFWGRK